MFRKVYVMMSISSLLILGILSFNYLHFNMNISNFLISFSPQGIKGDRGPAGAPGDKGEKVYLLFINLTLNRGIFSVFKEITITGLSDMNHIIIF